MAFKINGKEVETSPLTINSIKELTKILYNGKGEFVGFEKINVNKFMKDVVFRNNDAVKDIDFCEISYDQIDDIIAFFLEQNPKAKQRLKELINLLEIDQIKAMAGL